jgi:hypothetical protein
MCCDACRSAGTVAQVLFASSVALWGTAATWWGVRQKRAKDAARRDAEHYKALSLRPPAGPQ